MGRIRIGVFFWVRLFGLVITLVRLYRAQTEAATVDITQSSILKQYNETGSLPDDLQLSKAPCTTGYCSTQSRMNSSADGIGKEGHTLLDYMNPFIDDSRYIGKKICHTKVTWINVVYPWSVLVQELEANCSLLYGNLVLAGVTEADDLTILDQLEEISGYLVIHSVGRRQLRLPRLRIIRGQSYLTVRSHRVALLVASNYQATPVTDLEAANNNVNHVFLESLEMPQFISLLHHGVYFYDNPGLCYAPFTLKWDDLLESADRQSVHLHPLRPGMDLNSWYETCQCRHTVVCNRAMEQRKETHKLTASTIQAPCNDSSSAITTTTPLTTPLMSITTTTDNSTTAYVKCRMEVNCVVNTTETPRCESCVPNAYVTTAASELIDNVGGGTNACTLPSNLAVRSKRDVEDPQEPSTSKETTEPWLQQDGGTTNSRTEPTASSTSNKLTESNENGEVSDGVVDTIPNTLTSTASSTIFTEPLAVESSFASSDRTVEITPPTSEQFEGASKQGSTSPPASPSSEFPSSESVSPLVTTDSPISTFPPTNHLLISVPTELPELDRKIDLNSPPLPCHPSCPELQGRQYCWGPLANQCQAIHKCQQQLCDGSNWCFRANEVRLSTGKLLSFGSSQSSVDSQSERQQKQQNWHRERCCHSECAAGCHGPRAKDCHACLRYSNNGVCTSTCPARTIYNKTTFRWHSNPEGRIALAWKCVTSCPVPFLLDREICVPKCSRPGTHAHSGQCVGCPYGLCPKICAMKDIEVVRGVDYLRRTSLALMENCTIFEGDVKLSRQSFIGDPFYNFSRAAEGVHWVDLIRGLSKLHQITGSLYISAGSDAPWLTNLTFLSSLQIVGGASPQVQQSRAININSNQHLEFLGFNKLRHINHPSVLITGNPNLCFVDSIAWSKLVNQDNALKANDHQSRPVRSPDPGPVAMDPHRHAEYMTRNALTRAWLERLVAESQPQRRSPFQFPAVYVTGNGHSEFCRGRSAQCAHDCTDATGCWGPGSGFCWACRTWSVRLVDGQRLCVDQCELVVGHFTPKEENNATNSMVKPTTPNINKQEKTPDDAITTEPGLSVGTQPEGKNTTTEKQCGTCSSMCRSVVNACHGPGADECNGPCRWVQDGPYCRGNCPPNKFTNMDTKKCEVCAITCSQPLRPAWSPIELGSLQLIGRLCDGAGDWPGSGGCTYCRQVKLRTDVVNNGTRVTGVLQCVDDCPRDTFVHVINLHHRGGSSRTESNQTLDNKVPWTDIDAVHFRHLEPTIQEAISEWLLNHTQPRVYGLARLCLPCDSECARPSEETGAGAWCSGPGPTQCLRCSNASFEGRCVSACPSGTYAQNHTVQLKRSQSLMHGTIPLLKPESVQSILDVRGPFECHACHRQCRDGCYGPTAKTCHRCRRVKVFINQQHTHFRCAAVCPPHYPHRIRNSRTGDTICAKQPITTSVNQSVSIPGLSNENGHQHSNIQPHQSANDMDWPNVQPSFLSVEAVGAIASLSALAVLLFAVGCIIYWVVMQQPERDYYEEAEEDLNHNASTDNRLARFDRFCEKLWSRGIPRGVAYKVGRMKVMVDGREMGTTIPKSAGKLSNVFEWDSSATGGLEQDFNNGGTAKPNMATLRIITESQLMRGPLIGSGAFGTVFCGIWRPQMQQSFSSSSSETISITRSPGSVLTSSTTCSLLDWSEKLDALSERQTTTQMGGLLQAPSHVYHTSSANQSPYSPMTRNSSPGECGNVDIPVAIKVLTDSANPQTNQELLEEAKRVLSAYLVGMEEIVPAFSHLNHILKVMATVDHPCCLRFLALCLTSRLQLVTQFLPLGSLLDFVQNHIDVLRAPVLLGWAEQIASGMAHLASRGIIHRDLAARNVLVESLDQIRITDFGLAKCLDCRGCEYRASGGRMPIKWLAIECIQDRIFSSKSDVWSYGVTIWEMCTFGRRPFAGIRARDLLERLERGLRLSQPAMCTLDFYTTLVQCWEVNPSRRPSFEELRHKMSQMRNTPERYLIITSGMRQRQRTSQDLSTSTRALEFLTRTFSTSTSSSLPFQLSNPIPTNEMTRSHLETTTHPTTSSSTDSTEYAQMQADWMRNLYVNSQTRGFLPTCVYQLINQTYPSRQQQSGQQQQLSSIAEMAVQHLAPKDDGMESYCQLSPPPFVTRQQQQAVDNLPIVSAGCQAGPVEHSQVASSMDDNTRLFGPLAVRCIDPVGRSVFLDTKQQSGGTVGRVRDPPRERISVSSNVNLLETILNRQGEMTTMDECCSSIQLPILTDYLDPRILTES